MGTKFINNVLSLSKQKTKQEKNGTCVFKSASGKKIHSFAFNLIFNIYEQSTFKKCENDDKCVRACKHKDGIKLR